MSRDRDAGAALPGPALPLVPLALAAAAIVAAILATQAVFTGLLAALAVVLTALACTAAGALWHRQKVQDRLTELRQQQHLLLQLTDAWVWQTDADHRLVRLQPPQGAPASSWAQGAFGGQLLWDRFDDPESALAPRMQAQSPLPETAVHSGPAGQGHAFRLRGLPCHDSRGRFSGYLGTARPEATAAPPPPAAADEAAAAPEQAPTGDAGEQALATDHAALSYTISHDLRAPLRVVEGFGRILKEDYGGVLDRIGNDHLDRMIAAAARMNHMIDALLALSQLSLQPLARQPVNLSQLAQYIVDDLRHAHPERQVTVAIEPGLTAVGDPTLLRTTLDNLLGNAWKYTARRADAEVGFGKVERDGRTVFVVSDNGAGFDMRFADRLFGVFQRLHSSSEFQGTGIGLASVRRIVRRHGGEIWAESAVGQGARFYFTLAA
jgi:signal transduction histidine kinase